MFDLGIQELIVIFVVALLVFGPKKLPELGRSLGKGIAELKKAMHGVKEQMDAELHEIKEPISLDEDVHKSGQKTEDKIADSAETEKNTKNV
ncbi:hypothetical protein JZK55_11440 [Dissulfurispira thermophila]|uniref:Sec-independent protein translocase protein TatA n=2 Tax=root TaxID=1 RepID=A0A7G1H1Y5_9BACT|nr:Sec-independent protein translocase protein TatB [Dissulfurispira thermophila]BCB96222.1 hypothetical protein JZK55_11440 [Dissulfurispira thermophila]